MAVRYAVATGNWSNTATWDGGTLPASGDDVYADGKTVTIDQNVTVANIYNLQRVGGTIGGTFTVSANGFTITANIAACGNASFPTAMSITATGTTTIIGNITGNINTPTNAVGVGLIILAGTVNVTGNVQGGGLAGSNNNGSHGISVQNSSILNLTGNTTGGGSSSGTYGILFANTSRGVITGNSTGGLGGNGSGIHVSSTLSNALVFNGLAIAGPNPGILNASTGTVTINGNQTAVGNANAYCITNTSTGVININGDCLGALSATPSLAYVLNNSWAGIVNINGSVTARSVSPTAGTTFGIVNNNSTGTINVSTNVGTIDVTGTATAGLYTALWSTNINATNILRGNITNAAGVPAYNVFKLKISTSAAQQLTYQDTSNNNRVLATSNISPNVPLVGNVRLGIVYGSIGEYTGTMAVPTIANVRKGVATDNTLGIGELTAADFLDAILASSNAAAVRLKNVSTTDITGNQIASYQ
jgi:hypothetical protein